MRRFASWWGPGIAFCSIVSCGPETKTDEPVEMVQSPVAVSGDPVRGKDMLINNGTVDVPYLSCGLPTGVATIASWLGVDLIGTGPKLKPEDGRKRGMENLPYGVSLAKRPSGIEVITGSCLHCHAAKLGDSVHIGLGNANADFTQDQSFFGLAPLALDFVSLFLTPAENVELARYRRVSEAVIPGGQPIARPKTIGLNPAVPMFGVLAANRDPETLRWLSQPDPDAVVADVVFTDVISWWGTKRRQNLFYSGYGRQGHARIMMTASLACLEDSAEAAKIDEYFDDIEAYIHSLEPPAFSDVAKRNIDTAKATSGRAVFLSTCSGCHGDSKANPPIPPRASVPVSVVGTDPWYANYSSASQGGQFAYFFDWFNESWYGTHEPGAGHLERETVPSYQPPPLDGVWATAPYFHNGSVPTLAAVLDPTLRPKIFRRSFKPEEYDFGEKVGWPFVLRDRKGSDTTVYDTNVKGYSNSGHTFAAGLSATDRRNLLEYLKTL